MLGANEVVGRASGKINRSSMVFVCVVLNVLFISACKNLGGKDADLPDFFLFTRRTHM